jgi:murein DD-endopeptidase MepM/ murein hydrolase activator NlpD
MVSGRHQTDQLTGKRMGNHRAERQSGHRPAVGATAVTSPATSPAPGRRRAAKPTGIRRLLRLPARIPSVPTIVGIAALAVAGAGAVTVDVDTHTAPKTFQLSAQGNKLTGTDAVGYTGSPRERAISRDSERQALEDAAQAKLEAAAEKDAAERNAELKSLGRAAEARAGQIAKNQWVLPTTGYHLTARFGMAGGLWSSNHTGLDFAAPSGTPIVAVANGKITKTGSAGAYGNQTIETLADGTEIWYCHQTSIGVSPGDSVTSGQQIGTVGSTGNTTGPHLHLEVRPGGGDPVDPFGALVFHGVTP